MVKYYYFVNFESILICIEFLGSDKGGDGDSHILTHHIHIHFFLGRWSERKGKFFACYCF